MSRKGTPTDNSPIETFYLDGIYRTTNAHMIQIVKDYITYNNNIRIQTKLNSQSYLNENTAIIQKITLHPPVYLS